MYVLLGSNTNFVIFVIMPPLNKSHSVVEFPEVQAEENVLSLIEELFAGQGFYIWNYIPNVPFRGSLL